MLSSSVFSECTKQLYVLCHRVLLGCLHDTCTPEVKSTGTNSLDLGRSGESTTECWRNGEGRTSADCLPNCLFEGNRICALCGLIEGGTLRGRPPAFPGRYSTHPPNSLQHASAKLQYFRLHRLRATISATRDAASRYFVCPGAAHFANLGSLQHKRPAPLEVPCGRAGRPAQVMRLLAPPHEHAQHRRHGGGKGRMRTS